MPPKRRAASGRTASNQSTLTFNGRSSKVSKPGKSVPGKDAIVKPKSIETPIRIEPVNEEPTTRENALIEQVVAEAKKELTPEEEEANKISEAQIKKYWREKEQARKTPRVHQQELSLNEKILREFDTTSHFGPCIGITREKRWKRAHRLGLNPSLEILAVVLKEEEAENVKAQRSYVDELMMSRFDEV
ncbi:hypothetical protein P152DRAFT_427452 [Eremomyces bilateralis CBS 781.70]|uniref:DNA polymerase delta subunit 4 n=1 Tax=Eremomyces bilateralis CBS 781.70 TaxID=1392243 RepID=A0A6G1GHS3_9PEZI|nr:uncharacterized protein P152DRAFT_427452 [Eremomyces bilateralis CBS 781.70]KAF1817532.1 hypothetical protein P152DRAFT_427452 [Eremomyces bilateralis CBS 781.70]